MNQPEQQGDTLLTPEQVCELLGGITCKTLREWNNVHRHRKTLAPIRFTHKLVRYERRNVQAFIDKCRSTY
ncbi:hypothetical protein Q4519_06905 [Motilimonas sp. 1_MG-2023]|uniref:helix-turn-helix transcriptional regulator n=1 Tax=Motilimonas sp. 1_MG-2023 TaxID=3062672 RepID=UPI0026E2A936|nr:hypothetical protein [Motilimonas sp. 1_MG-2023]MDO6525410.1 hypothetical protein [Motilimonas sp. 1_MG-2023]